MGLKTIVHTLADGPWHFCDRCDDKTKIRELKWQRGMLLCSDCIDDKLDGDREVLISKVLSDGKTELGIDPKLQAPETATDDDDIFL